MSVLGGFLCRLLSLLYAILTVNLQVVSTLFTFALVAGAAYVFLKSKSGSSSGTNQDTDGGDDSLAAARRIMDKYK